MRQIEGQHSAQAILWFMLNYIPDLKKEMCTHLTFVEQLIYGLSIKKKMMLVPPCGDRDDIRQEQQQRTQRFKVIWSKLAIYGGLKIYIYMLFLAYHLAAGSELLVS